jgi:hypothetical protein
MRVWESDGALSLLELLKADPKCRRCCRRRSSRSFDLGYHLKHVDTISSGCSAVELKRHPGPDPGSFENRSVNSGPTVFMNAGPSPAWRGGDD